MLITEASSLEAYTALEAEEKNGTKATHCSGKLSLSQIVEVPQVFQPRDTAADLLAKKDHINKLITAIYNSPKNELPPVTVWWSGKRWVLLDGHHRIAAYKGAAKAGKYKPRRIPVRVFKGTLIEALEESTIANSKDKLPMTGNDKLNRAWWMVTKEVKLSKARIAKACSIGEATVGRMRRQLRQFKNKYPEDWQEEAISLKWWQAQKMTEEPKEFDKDRFNKEVEKGAKALGKAFRKDITTKPELFWKTIEAYSENLANGVLDYLGVKTEDWYFYDDEESDF